MSENTSGIAKGVIDELGSNDGLSDKLIQILIKRMCNKDQCLALLKVLIGTLMEDNEDDGLMVYFTSAIVDEISHTQCEEIAEVVVNEVERNYSMQNRIACCTVDEIKDNDGLASDLSEALDTSSSDSEEN